MFPTTYLDKKGVRNKIEREEKEKERDNVMADDELKLLKNLAKSLGYFNSKLFLFLLETGAFMIKLTKVCIK